MKTKTQLLTACLILLPALMAGLPQATSAQPKPSHQLVLPYFQVPLRESGQATVFTVTNTTDQQITVQMAVRSNWGIPIILPRVALRRYQEKTFNLHDWIVSGKLPDRQLNAGKTAHVQAALSGKRSPKKGKFYSTRVGDDLAVGYVTIWTPDDQALCGDCFIITPDRFVEGELLIDPTHGSLCRRHAVFLFLDGRSAGETKVALWTGKEGQTSNVDRPPHPLNKLDVFGYTTAGVRKKLKTLEVLSSWLFTLEELGWEEGIRWLELVSDTDTFVAAYFFNKEHPFSAPLRTCCLPPPDGSRARAR